MSVCDAIDASAACCGVGDNVDDVEVEPSLGDEGGVGYMEADGMGWCLPLRREEIVGEEGLLRKAAAEVK
jgi:hypothetical protein